METEETTNIGTVQRLWLLVLVYVTVLELVRPKAERLDDVPPDERHIMVLSAASFIRSKTQLTYQSAGPHSALGVR
jgi:hypothetical protein